MARTGNSLGKRLGTGAVGGIASYVAGYLVVYLLTASDIQNSFVGRLLDATTEGSAAWKVVGWVFYNGHFVNTNVPGIFGGTSSVNLIAEVDAFSAIIYVVPPVMLLLAGLAAAWVADGDGPVEGAKTGAGVAVGYAVLAVVGTFLFAISTGDAAIAPDTVTGILLAGLVYPLVFGAVGGALSGVVGDSESGAVTA
ncbi:hypothetical protein SAMN04487949_1831 [Halogranum gelatinilyticum]|uniref:DUF7978 domain-containing protein n=1 Tax=Halogranum gelatinilyticum TaxID=660521 RepID=A0A1G9TN60_9EURY|nr:hypothetical protein [Halogranum gelatinilyticum]SDM48854.1 hypothetical protein SAMN04487949_1831 [Halogranum gelatinilyticum]